jgi:polar amino acid transport system substrate-binding protein
MADIVQAGTMRLGLFLPQYDRDAATGELRGLGTGYLALEIARELATRLGVECVVMEFPTPTKAVEGLKSGACDVAFLGIEPSRTAVVDFSPPIFQFDYTYLVPGGSSIESVADADQSGIKIAIVRGHASALALTRIVKHAAVISAEMPDDGFELLRAGNADALAFPRDHLLECATKLPASRVLKDSYGVNLVGMAMRKGQVGPLAYLSEFVAQAKQSGLIARAIQRSALPGFAVAP